MPVGAFATVDAKRDGIEKLLLQKVGVVTRQFYRDVITRVRIIPESRTVARTLNALDLSPDVLRRIWERDGFRLFITHRAQDKLGAAELKAKLSPYGLCGFVAHQDIAPNQIWQSEIERALVSMHALAALITPGFDTSVWSQRRSVLLSVEEFP